MGLARKQLLTVIVLLAGTLLVVLNATFLSPALPTIMEDFGVSATTVQWLTSGYMLVEAVVIPMNAFFVGRFSTRKLFLGGIAWFALAAGVCAAAPSFPFLLLGRVMQAMATGVVMPMVITIIMLTFPREKRGSAMGVVGLIISFAPAIGPSVSGVIVDSLGWRVLFVVVAALAVVVVLFSAFLLENANRFARVSLDPPSVALLLVGMVSLLLGISRLTSSENVAVEIGLIVAVAFRQTKLETPLLRVQVLKSRKFRTAVLLIALLQASLVGSELVLPIYVQDVMAQTATVSGLLMLPGAVLGALCGVLSGRLFDRYGVRGVTAFGAVVMSVAALGVTQFNMTMPILLVACVYTVISIGIQFLITPLNTWGVNSLDNSVVQHANALSQSTNQVGASIGTCFISSLIALGPVFAGADADALTVTFTGVHIAFCGMCTILLIVAAGILLFVRTTFAERSQAARRRATEKVAPKGVAGIDRPWTVSDVMNPLPVFVREGATVSEAVDVMRSVETSGVPIVDRDDHVLGFLSDGDVLGYLSRQDTKLSSRVNVFALMDDEDFWGRLGDLPSMDALRLATRKVVSVESEVAAEDAFKILSEKRIKKVPVLQDGKLVGMLSRRNVLNALRDIESMVDTHNAALAAQEQVS